MKLVFNFDFIDCIKFWELVYLNISLEYFNVMYLNVVVDSIK